MSKFECTFYRPEKVNTREFGEIVRKLERDFQHLNTEAIDREEVYKYVTSLVDHAKPLPHNPEMYFLGLDEPGNMPSDARVDFFFMPTYIGTAIIIRAIMMFPEFMEDQFDLKNKVPLKCVLQGLLLGCTARSFMGSGFNATEGMLEAMKLFSSAYTKAFLETHPDICPVFSKIYFDYIEIIREKAAEGSWKAGFDEEYIGQAEEVLAILDDCNTSSAVLCKDELTVLRKIRTEAHRVSVKVMIDETELDRDRTAAAIKSLQEKSLIRQDRRTMPLPPKMDNAEYYTIRDKRTYIDSIIS